jgi:hypothetical protein
MTLFYVFPNSLNLVANNFGTGSNFVWSSTANFSDTLNTSLNNNFYQYSGDTSMVFYIKTYNQDCELSDSISIQIISSEIDIENQDLVCKNDPLEINLVNNSGI